ncbi:MAG: type I-B CRISPR-associated protein Cas5b [Endomicrobia bacterium]|nr:type I-B CRISPR-associated protein Cas5b [Endomicrobiia bacterium]
MKLKFLIFDIWGDFAHFKKYYTTSSPLTFSIPPRTTLIGLVSAILGIKKEDYFEVMKKDKAYIALRILNPIKKTRIGINLIDTKVGWIPVRKSTSTGRTQIKLELLKDPKYRIYFYHKENDVYETFKKFLQQHKSVYTPYLGISEFICDFNFIEETDATSNIIVEDFVEVSSVIPLDEIIMLGLKEGKYFKEKIPTEIETDRVVSEYREVIYEADGKKIKCKIKNGIKLSNGEIITIL